MQNFRTVYLVALILLVGMVFSGSVLGSRDVEGSEDHPLITRYDDSYIIGYEVQTFGEYFLALSNVLSEPMAEDEVLEETAVAWGSSKRYPEEFKRLEGKVTKITYLAPAERTSLEIYRNYEHALQRAGFEFLFESSGDPIRYYGFWHGRMYPYRMDFDRGYARETYLSSPQNPYYLVSRLSRAEGDIYIALYIHTANRFAMAPGTGALGKIQLDVIELTPMEIGLVSVDTMFESLRRTGQIAIHDIHFAFDSAELLEESMPMMEEIARLLQEYPDLKLYVVGHTDSRGALEYNISLSERRARSVTTTLVNDYGIASGRLVSAGIGPLAPVASNETEEGRALNRRVVLVLMPDS